MAIRNLEESNIRIVDLGFRTTGISQVHVGDDRMSSGIAFSDTLDGTLSDNGVIIQITNSNGVVAYLRAIFGLLETWECNDDIKEQLRQLQAELAKLMDFKNKD